MLSVPGSAGKSSWRYVLSVFPGFSGVAFGLNPLGDEGDVLPVTLTTTVSGRTFVRAWQSSASLSAACSYSYRTRFGLFSPFNTTDLTAALLLAAALLWCSVLLAPAAGVRFPRFSTVSAGRAQNILPPSLTASTPTELSCSVSGCSVRCRGSFPKEHGLSSLDSFRRFSRSPWCG